MRGELSLIEEDVRRVLTVERILGKVNHSSCDL